MLDADDISAKARQLDDLIRVLVTSIEDRDEDQRRLDRSQDCVRAAKQNLSRLVFTIRGESAPDYSGILSEARLTPKELSAFLKLQ